MGLDELSIVDDYPSEAAFGTDYFSRAARGDIVEQGPDGPVIRPEKVIITDRHLDYEGRICVGERTIRHLAHAFGMVDGWRVQRIIDDNHSLREELAELSIELAKTRAQVTFMQEIEKQPIEKVWLALDGTEHASQRGSMERTAKIVGSELRAINEAIPVPLGDLTPEEARP